MSPTSGPVDKDGIAFGPLGPNWVHLCVDMQRMFAEATDWLTYDIPRTIAGRAWKGRFRGQRQKWFAIRFTGDDSEIDITCPGGHKPEFAAWRWQAMRDLPDLVVPFKRPVYERVVREFAGLASA